ncbi:MAG: NAD-dependent epimerase/dehydratase family protein [Cyanobacteria bacterium P01_H01_bin.121]
MAKVFVTGANGFTGSHLVKYLLARGDQVLGLMRRSSNHQRLESCDLERIYGDITDRAIIEAALEGVEIVFHTAAYVELGLVDATEMARVNVDGTLTLLEAAQQAGVKRFVYCSTIGVLGDTAGQVVTETFQRQQAGFSSAYDRTKYEAQQLVDQAAQAGLATVSLLPGGIFGADDPHFGPVVQLYLRRRLWVLPGGDRQTGIVHVDDLVEALCLAAERGTPGGRYIIIAGELTLREMFMILAEQTGIAVPKEPPQALVRLLGNILDPLGRLTGWNPPLSRERVHYLYDRCVRVDASKARQELGWQPRSVRELLNSLLADCP